MVSRSRTILLGLLAALPLISQPAEASPADDVCELFADKTAHPTNVLVGQAVEITLTLEGRCPQVPGESGADIVLAIDRSASQYDNGTWEPTIQAATTFVDLIDFNRSQVGIFTFSGQKTATNPFAPETVLRQELTSDGNAVKAALAAIPPPLQETLWTNLTAAVEAVQAELASPRHRPDVPPVLVLLTDGRHNALFAGEPTTAATVAKNAGTVIITIGLAVDETAAQVLRAMASRPDLYFPAPTGDDLEAVLTEVAGEVTSSGRLTELTVTDLLPPEVEYVPGSAEPPPSAIEAGTLTWTVPQLAESGWTARYRIRPTVPGTYAANKLATASFTDADGSAGSRVFPQPILTVREPEPIQIYLPVLFRDYCQPVQPFDVVLALDTSSSMWGEKLVRTREAARAFLRFLEMPPSQAAVVAFNIETHVVQALTADRAAALGALDRLPRGEGTRIDLALEAATNQLTGSGSNPQHAPVIILLTDGRQAGASRQTVLAATANARRFGVTIYTIGIGSDVDPDLLTLVAGQPDRYFFAPTTADLLRIYRDIAGALPCLRQ